MIGQRTVLIENLPFIILCYMTLGDHVSYDKWGNCIKESVGFLVYENKGNIIDKSSALSCKVLTLSFICLL